MVTSLPKDAVAINGFPGYFITPSGDVYSSKTKNLKRLKNFKHRQGYENVHLTVDGVEKIRYIHRLMAEAFLDSWDPLLQVNHINGIKDDNRLDNFEMVSNSGNQKHAFRIGLQMVEIGYRSRKAKVTEEQFESIINTDGLLTARQIREQLGLELHLESIRRIRLKYRTGVYNGSLV